MYEIPLSGLEENLMGNVFRVSDKDLLSLMLINESASGSLQACYELVYHNDLLEWAECLLRKNACGEYRRRKVFF